MLNPVFIFLSFYIMNVGNATSEPVKMVNLEYVMSKAETMFNVQYGCRQMQLMDSITDYIYKTSECFPKDNLIKQITQRPLTITVHKLNRRDYTYEETFLGKKCQFYSNGSYYIRISFGEYMVTNLYGFKYNGLNFVSPCFLQGFYTTINDLVLTGITHLPDDIDETGLFYDWRFVVRDGNISTAYCCSLESFKTFDIKKRYEIGGASFFRLLPQPAREKEEYEPDDWIMDADFLVQQ